MGQVVCLMGATAVGKTDLVFALADRFPLHVISVDSAQVYRGMDIGTAKPSPIELARCPHALIDIRDAATPYSAGDFCVDALSEIDKAHAANKLPVLVGGTMLYFHALIQGMAALPPSNPAVRERLSERLLTEGLPALYRALEGVDPVLAGRLQPTDKQRILRGLEVAETTDKPLSVWHAEQSTQPFAHDTLTIALMPLDRSWLHARIEQRFHHMLSAGFLEEVAHFYKRDDLAADSTAMRIVGYRQAWQYLSGEINRDTMIERAIIATRQLAKRQLTWQRGWDNKQVLNPAEAGVLDKVVSMMESQCSL